MSKAYDYDAATGELIIRDLTPEEIQQIEDSNALYEIKKQEEEQAKIKRQELLEKLGITEDEAKLLLS